MTAFRTAPGLLLAALFAGLAGCTNTDWLGTEQAARPAPAATPPQPPPSPPARIIAVPQPIPMPGQLQPLGAQQAAPKPVTMAAAVDLANKQSLQTPNSQGFINSMMVYDFMPSALYQVYTAPQKITDIEFEAGEDLVSFAAGDTVRWLVDKTYSGSDRERQDHLLIKPVRSGLENTLVVTTTKRSYHMQLKSLVSTYMASVSWRYPAEGGLVQGAPGGGPIAPLPPTARIAPTDLQFDYKVRTVDGDSPAWKPDLVFSDGIHTYIRFPNALSSSQAPVLYVIENGEQQLVNYRVQGNYYIVDRLFHEAELRVGEDNPTVVQIARKGD
jgi:type IV secretion system protein VirB9